MSNYGLTHCGLLLQSKVYGFLRVLFVSCYIRYILINIRNSRTTSPWGYVENRFFDEQIQEFVKEESWMSIHCLSRQKTNNGTTQQHIHGHTLHIPNVFPKSSG